LRKRVALAGVLADDASEEDVVLVALAVDEDVRVEPFIGPEDTSCRSGSVERCMPGARTAKFRKLRLSCGRSRSCCVLTLVPISLDCVSMTGAVAETVTCCSALTESVKSRAWAWPRITMTLRVSTRSLSVAVTV
jgi:hypothetical protein